MQGRAPDVEILPVTAVQDRERDDVNDQSSGRDNQPRIANFNRFQVTIPADWCNGRLCGLQ